MAPAGGVVDISSDEDDFLTGNKSSLDPLEWAPDLYDVDDDVIGEDFDDLIIMSEMSSPPVLQRTVKPHDLVVMSEISSLPVLQKKAKSDDGLDEDDDDCLVLDGDPDKAVAVAGDEGTVGDGSSDELQIVAEKGPIACRDFPHSRHLCSNLPFNSTSHMKHCSMCHCFVCDALAPCKYWGNGTSSVDHCHATDKEAKWKTMRQVFKCKYLPASCTETYQNSELASPRQQPIQRQFEVPQSLPSSVSHVGHPSLAIQSSLLNEGSQNQQRHPSVRVSLSVGGTVSSPRAGRGTRSAQIAQNSRALFKRARAVSPGFALTTASRFGSIVRDNSQMHQASPHVSHPVQVAPRSSAFTPIVQNNPFQRSFSAPIASLVQQGLPAAHCQVATNDMDVIGPQLSRCTSLTPQRTKCMPGPVTDICSKSWEDILATMASDLGVSDYNINTTESQHVMIDTQLVHSTANQGSVLQPESIAEIENLASLVHEFSNYTSDGDVQADGPMQTTENLDHLISQSSLVPNEAHPDDFASAPADVLTIEEAAHQLEISSLEPTNILFEFDWL